MDDYHQRKAERIAHCNEHVYCWRLRSCAACAGSGHYDHNGSPKCSACNGTGKERYRFQAPAIAAQQKEAANGD